MAAGALMRASVAIVAVCAAAWLAAGCGEDKELTAACQRMDAAVSTTHSPGDTPEEISATLAEFQSALAELRGALDDVDAERELAAAEGQLQAVRRSVEDGDIESASAGLAEVGPESAGIYRVACEGT